MKEMEALRREAVEVRKHIVSMLYEAGSGHPGGSLSCTEILVSLYNRILVRPDEPDWEDRDRVVLSKGHAAPALYAVLAEHGFFSALEFKRLRKLGGKLQGHPDRNKTPGVDACTGSLGLGISMAVGMAMAAKTQKKGFHVHVITGDGELQEGIVWEAFMAASHYKLDNLTVIIDRNGLQIDGETEKVLSLKDVRKKMEAFGFAVVEADGHDFSQLEEAFEAHFPGKPKCVLAHTVKGKGISYMENQADWHGKAIDKPLYEAAMQELEGGRIYG